MISPSLPLATKERWNNKSTQWSIFQDFLCVLLILHLSGFGAICMKKERRIICLCSVLCSTYMLSENSIDVF